MARKRDPAEIETDQIIQKIEDRLKVEYGQAEREIYQKVRDYYQRYDIKLSKWQEWVRDGKKTQADFDRWRLGQLAVGKRWEDLRDQLARDLYNTNQIANSIAKGYMPEVYALNHNYGTFECEKGSGIDTSYTLYSRESVENIFRDNPQMLPDPGRKVSREIAEGRAVRWNNQHIQSVAIQAILQGNNISDIATRLANAVSDSDRKAAIRNARTMATATQNRGRIDAYKRAESMGIKNKKMWLATIDMRTRHEHRVMDKVEAAVDKPFIVEGYKMMYPGDYSAPGRLVYNCRCTIRSIVEGMERRSGTSGDTDLSQIEGMTYEEWKKSKVEKAKNILRPDQRADAARAEYIREYAENPGLYVPSGRDMTLNIDSINNIDLQPEENAEAPRARRGQIDTGYKGKIEDEDLKDFNEAALRQIMKDTGYDEEKAKEVQGLLQDYFGGDYKKYSEGKLKDEIKEIDEALNLMPVYDGTIYRGMEIDSTNYDAFAGLEPGDSLMMRSLSSWTSKEKAAHDFSDTGHAVDSVIIRCTDNKSGVGVQHISKFNDIEAEVLLPSETSWTVTGKTIYNKYDFALEYYENLLKTTDLTEDEKVEARIALRRIRMHKDGLLGFDIRKMIVIDVMEE